MDRPSTRAALGVFLALAISSTALAQKTTGDITGTVTDATGAVLPGVSVNAVCTDHELDAIRRERRAGRLPDFRAAGVRLSRDGGRRRSRRR